MKVAQYGQWDGYLDGAGQHISTFIIERLNTPEKLEGFKEKCRQLSFISQEQIDKVNAECEGKPYGYLKDVYPSLHRDTGCEILDMINETNLRLVLDSSEFGEDTLFCEYAYVLDLDVQELEIYSTAYGKELERFHVPLVTKVKFADLSPNYMKDLDRHLRDGTFSA